MGFLLTCFGVVHRGGKKAQRLKMAPPPSDPTKPIDFDQIQKKIEILWFFLEKNIEKEKELYSMFDNWPIIWTNQGYIVSLSYAKKRYSFPFPQS